MFLRFDNLIIADEALFFYNILVLPTAPPPPK